MSLAHTSTHPLVRMFGFANRLGLFRIPMVNRGFNYAYFAYKRILEDPFRGLTLKHPKMFAYGHIIDVGANIGYTTTVFAKAVSKGYKIIAFEPDPNNFNNFLFNTQKINNTGIVLGIQAAVGDHNGSIELWINENHHADHRIATDNLKSNLPISNQIISVPLFSIDEYLSSNLPDQPVAFIKIDVQGYELCVCQGMSQTLKNNPNTVVAFEYSPLSMLDLGYEPEKLICFFLDRQYTLAHLTRSGNLVALNKESLKVLQTYHEYFDILAIPETHPALLSM